jgi:hypothetical protein
MRQPHVVFLDSLLADVCVVDDEAAAYRVVRPAAKRLAPRVAGRETHAVRVERKRAAPVEHKVISFVEINPLAAKQPQCLPRANGRYSIGNRRRIDQFRRFAFQTQHDRFTATVTLSGGAERAEQLDANGMDPREQPVIGGGHRQTCVPRASGRRCASSTGRSRS